MSRPRRTTPLSLSPPGSSGEPRRSLSIRLSRNITVGAKGALSKPAADADADESAVEAEGQEGGLASMAGLAGLDMAQGGGGEADREAEGSRGLGSARPPDGVNGAVPTIGIPIDVDREPESGVGSVSRSSSRRLPSLRGSQATSRAAAESQESLRLGGGGGGGCDPGSVPGGARFADDERSPGDSGALLQQDQPLKRQHQVPILLSWEGISFSIPVGRGARCRGTPRGRRRGAGEGSSVPNGAAGVDRNGVESGSGEGHREGLEPRKGFRDVLVDVSGFAGPSPGVSGAGKATGPGTGAVPSDAVPSDPISNALGAAPAGDAQMEIMTGVVAPAMEVEMGAGVQGAGVGSGAGLMPETVQLKGSITALMGPSGAGKTSLLNVLAGRRGGAGASGSINGRIRLNREEVNAARVRKVSGFVTQEDVLPETLTCYEHLMFHAALRIRTPVSEEGEGVGRWSAREARRKRVNEVRWRHLARAVPWGRG